MVDPHPHLFRTRCLQGICAGLQHCLRATQTALADPHPGVGVREAAQARADVGRGVGGGGEEDRRRGTAEGGLGLEVLRQRVGGRLGMVIQDHVEMPPGVDVHRPRPAAGRGLKPEGVRQETDQQPPPLLLLDWRQSSGSHHPVDGRRQGPVRQVVHRGRAALRRAPKQNAILHKGAEQGPTCLIDILVSQPDGHAGQGYVHQR
mmetsp:Transcript_103576/g.178489  ORF Transcript_103576/g.178489 Transcript_103576/m.178489 type:complete len:204 (-) Transcript_103576:369-980(-)